MALPTSMKIAAAGMSAQRARLELVASNLANAQTTRTARGGPYRKKLAIFRTADMRREINSPFADQLSRELKSVAIDRVIDDPSPFQRIYQPDHPDADATGYVMMPNINIVDEMVNMIGASRSYEANLEVMKTVKRMSNSALDLGRA